MSKVEPPIDPEAFGVHWLAGDLIAFSYEEAESLAALMGGEVSGPYFTEPTETPDQKVVCLATFAKHREGSDHYTRREILAASHCLEVSRDALRSGKLEELLCAATIVREVADRDLGLEELWDLEGVLLAKINRQQTAPKRYARAITRLRLALSLAEKDVRS